MILSLLFLSVILYTVLCLSVATGGVESVLLVMDGELKEKYNSLLACATQLCACCSSLSIDGSTKLAKQCQSELKFLHSVRTAVV